MTDGAAWERLPGESAKVYAAFCAYRDLGPKRSLRTAYTLYCEQQNVTRRNDIPGNWHGWSATFQWKERAEKWDADRQRKADEASAAEYQAKLKALREELEEDGRMQRERARRAQASTHRVLMDALDAPDGEPIPPGTAAYILQVMEMVYKGATDRTLEALGVATLQQDMMRREKALPDDSGFEEEVTVSAGTIADEEGTDD